MTTTGDGSQDVMEPGLWKRNGWTARVCKNADDDGWAVEMFRDGESEPVLTAPWTMGRDKKNPKPLDGSAFITWVKTAGEIVRRREQQLHAFLHRSVQVTAPDGRDLKVTLDIIPDEDDPHAVLAAADRAGTEVSRCRVGAGFRLTQDTARRWINGGMASEAGD